MIAKDQNSALLILERLAKKNLLWIDYANYCSYREKGLRKEAFNHLNIFLKKANAWNFEQKQEFVNFLFPIFESVRGANYGGFPQPLSEKLLKPTLMEWCEVENNNNNPFRWYGTYYRSEEYLLKALELNPKDDLARITLINRWDYSVYYSLHHLPDFYIGNPYDDIAIVEKIQNQISLLTKQELKDSFIKEMKLNVELIKNYMDWQISGHPNFEKWCKTNRKCAGFGLKAYYYDK